MESTVKKYNPKEIEDRWQKIWEKSSLYKTPEPSRERPKKYILDMFPYPSGAGLHVGHMEGYVATDVISRYLRMRGFAVLHPMGWDAFGLPAENYAIKEGVPPAESTHKNIQNFRKQLKLLGLSYDWDREINTSSPDYYKWTQWLFIMLFKKGLAYKKKAPANWCPKDETVLANEQVVDGKCERCGTEVVQKELDQWFFKITAYADELIKGLDKIDWPESTKTQQINWIGRKEGINIRYKIAPNGDLKKNRSSQDYEIEVFTTRPDTNFGATFIVLAPEHPLVQKITTPDQKEAVGQYVEAAKRKKEMERISEGRKKTGVFTGRYTINQLNGSKMPIWVSDFVLMSVGTGALVGVPGHDLRDFEFAKKFGLKIRPVVVPIFDQSNRDKDHEGLLIELLDIARKNNKRIIVGGGWASDLYLGFRLRNHEDLDFYVPFSEVGWWKSQTEKMGFVQKVLDNSKDQRFYVEMSKENNPPHYLWADFIGVGSDAKGFYDMEKGKKDYWDRMQEAEIVLSTEFFGRKVSYFAPAVKEWYTFKPLREKDKVDLAATGMAAYIGEGVLIDSGPYNGMTTDQAREKISDYLEHRGWGKRVVTYHIRDWLISRQRYWGCPIPMIYCQKDGWNPVPDADLPVLLPTDVDFLPHGESPIATSKTFQRGVKCPVCGEPGKREVDTMDTYVDSSWYFYRFADPKNDQVFASKEALSTWLPVDKYIGGGHVVQHLLFARFFHKVLVDLGYLKNDGVNEPFLLLRAPGWILGPDFRKMSKRWGNIITPEEVVAKHGADSMRVYEMFMAPFDVDKPWNVDSAAGVERFLSKIFVMYHDLKHLNNKKARPELFALLDRTVTKVGSDIGAMKFNTAISAMMEFYREIAAGLSNETGQDAKSGHLGEVWEKFLLILAPFAPHLTEELWHDLKGAKVESIHKHAWPVVSPGKAIKTIQTIVVTINSKPRGVIEMKNEKLKMTNEELIEEAKKEERVRAALEGKTVKKVIYVPGKILNLVVD